MSVMGFVTTPELEFLRLHSYWVDGESISDEKASFEQESLVVLAGHRSDTGIGNADHGFLAFEESFVVVDYPFISEPDKS